MRKRDLLVKAFPALLELAKQGSVKIQYRGIGDKEFEATYDLLDCKGNTLIKLVTEKELLESLIARRVE